MLRWVLRNTATFITAMATAVQPILAQSITGSGNQAAQTLTAPNGVPVVDINTPNGSGVSHNTYSQFDVGTTGVILNNGNTNFVETQLSGYIGGNANLRNGAASIILNEVVENNPSALNGFIEVAGVQADVIVANPYGITCDGCGFINTDHAMLTTGTPNYSGTNFDGVSVTQGVIEIGQGGANATGVSQFDLVARKVVFSGSVHGERIRVISGQNDVVFATGDVSERTPDGSAAPDVAIDSSVLGGMYAGKITIISTEDGVGVNAPKTMSSTTEGMHLTADGRLVMGRAVSTGGGSIAATDIVVETELRVQEGLSVAATQSLVLEADAVIVSQAAAMLTAGAEISLGANSQTYGKTGLSLFAGTAVTVGEAAKLLSEGTMSASAQTDLTIADDVVLSSLGTQTLEGTDISFGAATIESQAGLNLAARAGLTTHASLQASGQIEISAPGFSNSGVIEAFGANLIIKDNTEFNNTGGTLYSAGTVRLETGAAIAAGATSWGTVRGDTALSLLGLNGGELTSLIIAAGDSLVSDADLTIRAATVRNDGTLASGGGNLAISSSGDITNTGLIYAGGDWLELRAAGAIDNNGGVILAATNAILCGNASADCRTDPNADRAAAILNRHEGIIETIAGNLTLSAQSIENIREVPAITETQSPSTTARSGDCSSHDSNCTTTTTTVITQSTTGFTESHAQIMSGGDLSLNGGIGKNEYSLISAQGDIDIAFASFENIGRDVSEITHSSSVRVEEDWGRCGFLNLGWCLNWRNVYQTENDDEVVVLDSQLATIEAGGIIGGTVTGYLTNGAVNANTANRSASSQGSQAISGPTGTFSQSAATDGVLGGALGSVTNSALFTINPDAPNGFLSETRHEFIDLSAFQSSDYFLDQLGPLPLDVVQTRLGDAFIETNVVRDQLVALTGARFLDGNTSERDQLRGLYDNALAEAARLQLSPGVALTQSQVASLTSDIVWLEQTEVNGQTVLAPRLYLSGEVQLASAGTIRANTISLATGAINNSGSIQARDDLVLIAANDISNAGGTFQAGGDVDLRAGGEFSSVGGVIGGSDVNISATNVSLRTEALERVDASGNQTGSFGDTSQIAATGNLSIIALEDLTVDAANLSSGGDMVLAAGGDVDILSISAKNAYNSSGFESFSTRVKSSELTSGGDLAIYARGGDITLQAVGATANGQIDVTAAAGDVKLLAAANTEYSYLHTQSRGFLSTYEATRETLDVTYVENSFEGSGISIAAGQTLFDQSSSYTAGENGLAYAANNVIFDSVSDVNAQNSTSSSSFLFGLFSNSSETSSLRTTALDAARNSQADIDITSMGDLSITGGNFSAAGDITSNVAGETTLLAAVDTDFFSGKFHDNNGFIITDTVQVTVNQTAEFIGFEAGGNVTLDEDSTTTIGLNQTQAAVAQKGRSLLTPSKGETSMALLAHYMPEATGPPALNPLANAVASGAGDASSDQSHGNVDPAFDLAGSIVQAGLPTAETGDEFAYIDTLTFRDNVTVADLGLVQHGYEDTQHSMGMLTKAILAFATQGLGPWQTFAINQAANAAITGELDAEALVKSAAMQFVSVGFGEFAGQGTMPEFAGVSNHIKGSLGELSTSGILDTTYFSEQFLVHAAFDAGVSAAASSAIYGTDFGESFKNSLASSFLSEATAFAQFGVGEMIEGMDAQGQAFLGGLAHAGIACASAEIQNLDCGQAALAALGSKVVNVGLAQQGLSEAEVASKMRLVNLGLAVLTSGGDEAQFTATQTNLASQFQNNYLTHAEWAEREADRQACEQGDDAACDREFDIWRPLDDKRDAELKACAGVATQECAEKRQHLKITAADYMAIAQSGEASHDTNELLARGLIFVWAQEADNYMAEDRAFLPDSFESALHEDFLTGNPEEIEDLVREAVALTTMHSPLGGGARGGAVGSAAKTKPVVPERAVGKLTSRPNKSRTPIGLPENPSQLKHIFADRAGHLPDTPANRQLLLDTSNNPANNLGSNRFGNQVHVSTRQDGSQVWVETRNGIVQNGGVNSPPRTWFDGEGLR